MVLREIHARGERYLALVTQLLQAVRIADPDRGLWEAADFQWWWRTRRRSDEVDQLFLVDGADRPVAALTLTDWGEVWGCDPIVHPDAGGSITPLMVERMAERVRSLGGRQVEIAVRDDDEDFAREVTEWGFVRSDDGFGTAWMETAERPAPTPLPPGFELRDRAVASDRPHHMIRRSGDEVEARLAGLSLYRPDLDLYVESSDGTVAGYGLFWLDPTTGVGLVEPMRTEEPYQGRGLGRAVLTNGLDRLAALGARRLKISYELSNETSTHLYLSAGFRESDRSRGYLRSVDA